MGTYLSASVPSQDLVTGLRVMKWSISKGVVFTVIPVKESAGSILSREM